jgi:hypothetical protein
MALVFKQPAEGCRPVGPDGEVDANAVPTTPASGLLETLRDSHFYKQLFTLGGWRPYDIFLVYNECNHDSDGAGAAPVMATFSSTAQLRRTSWLWTEAQLAPEG